MPADLFNVRTVERLSRKVKVTDKQKNAAKLWLMNLDAGKLTAERHNYIKFANGVLRDILGYPEREIEESFEKGGVEFLFTNEEEQKVVCFELKGSDQDLFSTQHRVKKEQETPIKQTWDYMGKHNLDYGVTSNFREFVLIDKNKGYSKVHRFEFTSIKSDPSKLKEFIAIFSKKNLIVDKFAEVFYKESIIEERAFTKEFYKLFHETRLMLLKEFIDSGATQEQAIHYAQIFLNRLMFVLFAEDTGKLPRRLPEDMILEVLKNRLIINEHSNMVYEVIIGLYRQLDIGAKTPVEIFGFNGELFKEAIPRTFFFHDMREESYFKDVYQQSALKKSKQQDIIESNILSRVGKGISPIIPNILLMASFDFTTEVNVNILGHIFEQSITDIEKLQEGETAKRKKEGIFYTPEYITDYICRNTIIPYLSKNNATTTVEELINEHKDNFEVLGKKLKDLRILDPACGSGAFLIKAVDVLLEIHKALIEAKAVQGKYEKRVLGKRGQEERYLSFSKYYDEDEARKIIDDNIYGVDINEESVEITKLSLYLKIAREKKKLLDLSKNIKCGNSLIDDKEIDKKAFNWQKEFPEIFKQGGFDIVIGNPPYVRMEMFKEIKPYLREKYETHADRSDLYVYFYEKAHQLLADNGLLGFISSNTFMTTGYGYELRRFLQEKTEIQKILNFGETQFFEGATTYPILFFFKKVREVSDKHKVHYLEDRNLEIQEFLSFVEHEPVLITQKSLNPRMWSFESPENQKILNKISKNSALLKDYCEVPLMGIKTGLNDAFIIDQYKRDELIREYSKNAELIKPFLMGKNLKRWHTPSVNKYLIYIPRGIDINQYAPIKNELTRYKDKLEKRATKQEWYELQQPQARYIPLMAATKIIYVDIASKPTFSLDTEKYYLANSVYFLPTNDKYLLGILNSALIKWFIFLTSRAYRGGFVTFRSIYVERIPIKEAADKEKKPLIEQVESMINLSKKADEEKGKFIRRVLSTFNLDNQSKKLDSFWKLSFDDFQKEVYRLSKKKLSLKEQDEWEDYFNDYKEELTELQQKTDETDKAIDQMVYQLYELTPEEIKIVEEGI